MVMCISNSLPPRNVDDLLTSREDFHDFLQEFYGFLPILFGASTPEEAGVVRSSSTLGFHEVDDTLHFMESDLKLHAVEVVTRLAGVLLQPAVLKDTVENKLKK